MPLYPAVARAATRNVRSYGAKGDGVTNDTAAFAAALLAAANGGTVFVPIGVYLVDPLAITASADNVGSPTWQGGGIHILGESARRSVLKSTGGSLLTFTTDLSSFCSIEKLTLLGPGSGVAGSVAIDANTTPNLTVSDVYIRDFAVGTQTYIVTSWTWTNVRTWYCGIGIRFGYNSDASVFSACEWRNNTTSMVIGWQTGAYASATQNCTGLTFESCILAYSTLGLLVSDIDAQGINFISCYFEGNTKDAEIGVSGRGDLRGPQLSFQGTMHSATVSPPIAVGIAIYNRPSVLFDRCTTDGSNHYTIWCRINDTNATQVEMRSCQINAVTAALQIGTRNFNTTVNNRESLAYLGAQTEMFDFGVFPSTAARQVIAYNAASKTIQTWGRNTTAGAVTNQMQLIDKAGTLVLEGVTSAFIAATSVASLPAASANNRGCLAFVPRSGGTPDTLYVCLLAADGTTYSWKSIVAG